MMPWWAIVVRWLSLKFDLQFGSGRRQNLRRLERSDLADGRGGTLYVFAVAADNGNKRVR